jgi:hypothetical protein
MMLFVRCCEGARAWPASGRPGRACGGARRVRHRLPAQGFPGRGKAGARRLGWWRRGGRVQTWMQPWRAGSLVHGRTHTHRMFDALRLTYDASLFCFRGCLTYAFSFWCVPHFLFFCEIRNYWTEVCAPFSFPDPNAFILRVV